MYEHIYNSEQYDPQLNRWGCRADCIPEYKIAKSYRLFIVIIIYANMRRIFYTENRLVISC